jgi:hypothetical protein
MKLLIALILLGSVMRAEDPSKTVPVLTPADREPTHLALEALITAQAQLIQLQAQMPDLQKAYQAEVDKLKAKCGGELIQDKDKMLQCAPKPK